MTRDSRFLYLLGFILVAPIVSAQPRYTPRGETPLERYREPTVTRSTPAPVIKGRVAVVERDTIVTSVTSQDLLAHDFGDGDSVALEIGGKIVAARIVSMPTYLALADDPKAAGSLDVDVLGVINDRGQWKALLFIVGLGGGIAEWLGARPGMSVTLGKPR
jgi:hypothetical protein